MCLFFDVTVIKWNNFVDFNSADRNMVQTVTVQRKPLIKWILNWHKYFLPLQKLTVNLSQKIYHLNIQTLAVTVKALNHCCLMSECLSCVSCRMTEIICAYPAKKSLNKTTQHRTGGKRAENSSQTNWPFFNKRKAEWPNKWTKAIPILRVCNWHSVHRIRLRPCVREWRFPHHFGSQCSCFPPHSAQWQTYIIITPLPHSPFRQHLGCLLKCWEIISLCNSNTTANLHSSLTNKCTIY